MKYFTCFPTALFYDNPPAICMSKGYLCFVTVQLKRSLYTRIMKNVTFLERKLLNYEEDNHINDHSSQNCNYSKNSKQK